MAKTMAKTESLAQRGLYNGRSLSWDVNVTFKTRTGSTFKPNSIPLQVSTWLMPGKVLGLVGESGSGKSTTANVMCGLQAATSGKVFFRGEEVTKRSAADRRKIGRVVSVVFQDPATALNARMAVRDQLMDPLHVHKIGTRAERIARVEDLIQKVGLPHSALDALPGRLSGGQRRRVAIARALSLSPDAIIAGRADVSTGRFGSRTDSEPADGSEEQAWPRNGFHLYDIQTVRYISDTIAVMNSGKVVEQGPAKELLENPKHPYTQTLLGAAPSLLHPDLGTSKA